MRSIVSLKSPITFKGHSDELKKLAERWVARCTKQVPDPTKEKEYSHTMSTMAISYEPKQPTVMDMAKTWEEEKKFYTYADNSCSKLIWAPSTNFGCAMQKCEADKSPDKKPFYLMVCVYKTPWYQDNAKPYVSGRTCSRCPSGFRCHQNQCVQVGVAR
ncbi:unnamed protein product [Hymenolepis diminuta]|uniref:SCP domain-containing protein n=1 Tax=Hymenolepis diminuta TaxID=6216 RepID=A0A0R3SLX5_HYMDI|nr:unnamed protein product [Hymenolepis diminuta]